MARKARVEYPGACYHVINRGNYRKGIFESDGARKSFLDCLRAVCTSQHWRLHGWCLMSNHYHLLIETPEPNLVVGMKWLQSTFANRFNRFHRAQGHVFQGRYKSILLEESAMGPVCHYIHLNPVRARQVEVSCLQQYGDSSFSQLWYPRRRWSFAEFDIALSAAGGLRDTRSGRKAYLDYLSWLSADTVEQKRQGFAQMTRGWAKGSKDFKKAVLKDQNRRQLRPVVESEAMEIREAAWEARLEQSLDRLGKTDADLAGARKGEPWKIALARHLREQHLAPHRWIAERLHMGAPSSVQSLVSRHRRDAPQGDKTLKKLNERRRGRS